MYFNIDRNRSCFLSLCVWLTLLGHSSQFPPRLQGKRFNIDAVPAENGKILLYLKSRYGSTGTEGPMGDRGPPGTPGIPGLMGDQGESGVCLVEVCVAMQEARLLVSRLEALENLVKQHSLHSDVEDTKPSESPLMALHITSDILLTQGNFSNGKNGIPGNINVNIALKNAAPVVATGPHGGKFLVNSTVRLMDRSKINKLNSGVASSPELDGVSMTEQQFQGPRSSLEQDVPSIRKSRIPVIRNPKRL